MFYNRKYIEKSPTIYCQSYKFMGENIKPAGKSIELEAKLMGN